MSFLEVLIRSCERVFEQGFAFAAVFIVKVQTLFQTFIFNVLLPVLRSAGEWLSVRFNEFLVNDLPRIERSLQAAGEWVRLRFNEFLVNDLPRIERSLQSAGEWASNKSKEVIANELPRIERALKSAGVWVSERWNEFIENELPRLERWVRFIFAWIVARAAEASVFLKTLAEFVLDQAQKWIVCIREVFPVVCQGFHFMFSAIWSSLDLKMMIALVLFIAALVQLIRARQMRKEAKLIGERVSHGQYKKHQQQNSSLECAVCYEESDGVLNCGHVVCSKDAQALQPRKCPVCRRDASHIRIYT
eukprot:TRINITY_DN3602_c0_g1_i1.p1 TRINITY_DN3602_c0_g1~~TRINITY_DN3602_c0_g1_i1.p1  ORF type:complete len:304 (+),score=76.60 TRINITY_DN3602_c0_g1_i1:75-986(+)